MQKPTDEQLYDRFTYHPTKPEQIEKYQTVRESIRKAAMTCVAMSPASPEQQRALDKLDEAVMLFNAAIARNS